MKSRTRHVALPIVLVLVGAGIVWWLGHGDSRAQFQQVSAPASGRPAVQPSQSTGVVEKEERSAPATGLVSTPPNSPDHKATLLSIDQLIAEGNFQEALLECLHGYARARSARPGSPDCQQIMNRLVKLGRRYPAAMTALRALRDSAMQDLTANPTSGDFTLEVAMLNQRLGDDDRTIALLDGIPAGGPQHQMVAMVLYPVLVEKGRYADALLGKPFGQMITRVDAAINGAQLLRDQPLADFKKHFLQEVAKDVEVLVGAGRYDDALVLAERFFQLDGSEEARQLLMKRMQRTEPPKT